MIEAKVIAEKISLEKIKPIRENLELGFDLKDKEFQMNIAQSIKHNLERKSFKISLLVSFSCTEQVFAEYLYEFYFKVENILDFLSEKDGRTAFTGQLLGTLIGLSYSTLRGILYSRLAETNLNGIILPVVNPNALLNSKISE
ncbi:MAG: hypothetical protein LBV59_23245 [Sphingobacterium sp.]|jgi:hypothetical protein|uniref:hypothetical protein n=1 Tax=Sphingobacterium sp. TaxID=341027 RepID=UPI00283D25DE|nr:hypothetical protein [Sphingobacterium sp.]MDR3010862.1 hypothetical protein [Sphingobacterium sp.]